MKTTKELINEYMKSEGLEMKKMVHPGYSSLFLYRSPSYEYRTVYSTKEEQELTSQGYFLDQDMGCFIYNALT